MNNSRHEQNVQYVAAALAGKFSNRYTTGLCRSEIFRMEAFNFGYEVVIEAVGYTGRVPKVVRPVVARMDYGRVCRQFGKWLDEVLS